MRLHRQAAISVATYLAPGLARADTGGAGEWVIIFIIYYACIFYLISCVFSIPIALLLPGSKLKRIAIGLVVPIIGMGLGALTVNWLERNQYMYYVDNDGEMVFIVVSSIPVVLLLIFASVLRARAIAFERSRVRYAEYLEREKTLKKLAEVNSRRANSP